MPLLRRRPGSPADHPLSHEAWRYGSGQGRLLGVPRAALLALLAAAGTFVVLRMTIAQGVERFLPALFMLMAFGHVTVLPSVAMGRSIQRLGETGVLGHLALVPRLRADELLRVLGRQHAASALVPLYASLAVLLASPTFRAALRDFALRLRPEFAAVFAVTMVSAPLYAIAAAAITFCLTTFAAPRPVPGATLPVTMLVFFTLFTTLNVPHGPARVWAAGALHAVLLGAVVTIIHRVARRAEFNARFWSLAGEEGIRTATS